MRVLWLRSRRWTELYGSVELPIKRGVLAWVWSRTNAGEDERKKRGDTYVPPHLLRPPHNLLATDEHRHAITQMRDAENRTTSAVGGWWRVRVVNYGRAPWVRGEQALRFGRLRARRHGVLEDREESGRGAFQKRHCGWRPLLLLSRAVWLPCVFRLSIGGSGRFVKPIVIAAGFVGSR